MWFRHNKYITNKPEGKKKNQDITNFFVTLPLCIQFSHHLLHENGYLSIRGCPVRLVPRPASKASAVVVLVARCLKWGAWQQITSERLWIHYGGRCSGKGWGGETHLQVWSWEGRKVKREVGRDEMGERGGGKALVCFPQIYLALWSHWFFRENKNNCLHFPESCTRQHFGVKLSSLQISYWRSVSIRLIWRFLLNTSQQSAALPRLAHNKPINGATFTRVLISLSDRTTTVPRPTLGPSSCAGWWNETCVHMCQLQPQ